MELHAASSIPSHELDKADAWVLTVGPLISNQIGFFIREDLGRRQLQPHGRDRHDNLYNLQPLVFQKDHVAKCKVAELAGLYENLKRSELIHSTWIVNSQNLPEPQDIQTQIDALKMEIGI